MASQSNDKQGYPVARMTPYLINQLHLRQPLVTAWWSAAFPGFGHMMLCKYLTGFFLIAWEFFINVNSNLNVAIVYSMLGQWEQAKQVLDTRWFMFYMVVYVFTIWDSYRKSVELNHHFVLGSRKRIRMKPFINSGIEINYLDRRSPGYAVLWSLFLPGLAYLYLNRIPTAFIVTFIWIFVSYQANVLNALHLLTVGSFYESIMAINPQWFLFMPSIYVFALYDSYNTTVEYNKLYQREKKLELKDLYQSKGFRMP